MRLVGPAVIAIEVSMLTGPPAAGVHAAVSAAPWAPEFER